MPENLGDAVLRLRTDNRKLKQGIDQGKRQAQGLERQFQKTSKSIVASIRGIGAAFAAVGISRGIRVAIDAAREQAAAMAQLEQGVRSTGMAAGFTSAELAKMAAGLQQVTLFGDETIIRAQSILLTFTKIGQETFPRVTKATLDLAARMGTDLKAAAVQLGKALNDPISNLGELGRAGIQFSKEQKEVIKALAETNQLADAQILILEELETQFGDSAEAAAEAAGGPFTQLMNVMGDTVAEPVGGAFLKMLDFISRRTLEMAGAVNTSVVAFEGATGVYDDYRLAAAKAAGASALLAVETEKAAEAAAKARAEFRKTFEELTKGVDPLLRQLVAFGPGGIPGAPSIFNLTGTEGIPDLVAQRLEEDLKEIHGRAFLGGVQRVKGEFERFLEDAIAASWQNAIIGVTALLTDALRQAYFDGWDREDTRTLFREVGGEIGASAGAAMGAFAGPIGMIIGEMIGRVIGEIIGDILGDFISGIGDSGPQVGTATIGPGGTSAVTGFGASALRDAMAFMMEQIRLLEQLVGGSIDLTQQIAIHMDDTGRIWVDILDEMGNVIGSLGEFESLAEAAEAALIHLLQTANLSADMKQAFQDLIANAEDINQLFEDIKFIASLPRELARIGGPAQQAKAALLDSLKVFDEMRNRIIQMGLSAEATAEALAQVDQAQKNYTRSLELNIMNQLADLARHFGLSAKVIREAAVLAIKLKFFEMRLTLEVLGLMDRFGGLWRRLFRLSLQEARRAGRAAIRAGDGFQRGSQGIMDFGRETLARLHGREEVLTEGQSRGVVQDVQAIVSNLQGGGRMAKAMTEMRDELRLYHNELRDERVRLPTRVLSAQLKNV